MTTLTMRSGPMMAPPMQARRNTPRSRFLLMLCLMGTLLGAGLSARPAEALPEDCSTQQELEKCQFWYDQNYKVCEAAEVLYPGTEWPCKFIADVAFAVCNHNAYGCPND